MENSIKDSRKNPLPIILDGEFILGIPTTHLCTNLPCGKLIPREVQMCSIDNNPITVSVFWCPICNQCFVRSNIDQQLFARQYVFLDKNMYIEKYSMNKHTLKYRIGSTVHLKSSHICGNNEYIIKSYNIFNASYTLLCKKCNENIALSEISITNEIADLKKIILNKQKHIQKLPYNNFPYKHEISPRHILIRTNTFHCTYSNHILKDILLIVKILTPRGEIKKLECPGAYCITCQEYYMLSEDFHEISKLGKPICGISDIIRKPNSKTSINSLNEESILHLLGYNVNSQNKLLTVDRWNILELAIDTELLSKVEICSHLDYLITLNNNKAAMSDAITKWKIDREHINKYQCNKLKKIEVIQFTRNIYKK